MSTTTPVKEWTHREKVRIGYSMPRALIVTDEVIGTSAESLLMQGIAVGIALGRGNAEEELPYELLQVGVNLWAESRQAYFEVPKKDSP